MKKRVIIFIVVAALLLATGLSYAYFTGRVLGDKKELIVTSKNIRIVFTDEKEISNSAITPGWSESKKFSVKNESNDVFYYNIVFENLVNTFVTEGFLQYKITSTDGGYSSEGYLDIPKSSTPTDIILAYDIELEVDVTHNYTVEFVYHNSETVNQNDDQGKVFEGNLYITEGTINPNVKYSVVMNSENGTITPSSAETLKKGSLEFSVIPNTGYDISTMSVSCSPVANTVVIDNIIKVNDIRQSHNCEVYFDKQRYTVDIEVVNGKSNALNKIVEHGNSATAIITPDTGYTLENATVTGDGCSINNDTLTISNVVSDGKCIVTLKKAKYNVTLVGEGINTSNSPQESEYQGSTTINFTLSDGYELGSNVINCDNAAIPSISGNVLTVSNVTDNTTCTLSPRLKSYDVTLKVTGGTPISETKNVEHAGSTSFTVSAKTGYVTDNMEVSCTGNASHSVSGSTVTISNVTTSQTCTVELRKKTYTINVSVNSSTMGSVSPSSSSVEHGSDLSVTITPNNGYRYSSNTCGGSVSGNTMTISNVVENKNCLVTFTTLIRLSDKIKEVYSPKPGRTDFSVIDNGTPGLYTGEDDQGATYYFSGDGTDMRNWVSFAGKLWRIIRINGNGSVRLLYAGTGGEDGYVGSAQAYNGEYNNAGYSGWKYSLGTDLGAIRGNENKSSAYVAVENWYNGLSSTDKNYIDTEAIYCGDRDLESGNIFYASTNKSFRYLAFVRLITNKTPTFKCNNISDRFNIFGLMTADEVSYAGGVYKTQNTKSYYYLNKARGSSTGSSWWWTMSPSSYLYWNGIPEPASLFTSTRLVTGSVAYMFGVGGSGDPGRLGSNDVSATHVVRPVVSLKAEVGVIGGDGSSNNPYTVVMP